MANDVPVTAPHRDYRLTAPKRILATVSVKQKWCLLLDDGVSYILLDDGVSRLIFTADTATQTYGLTVHARDYVLTAPERQ
jgi:hypothetical protein